METMTIEIPSDMKQFVVREVQSGAYPSESDFVGSLIRAHQLAKSPERLERLLQEGMNSGLVEANRDVLGEIRAKILAKYPDPV